MHSYKHLGATSVPELHRRLQLCCSFRSLQPIHARIVRLNLDNHPLLLNALLRSLFVTSRPAHALLILRTTPTPTPTLSNIVIRGLVAADFMSDAILIYTHMRHTPLFPNYFTFPFVLKACARLADIHTGEKIHTHIVKGGFEFDVFVSTGLIGFYAKCGRLGYARKLFDEMPVRNVVSWTAIISAYIADGRLNDALGLFREMLEMGFQPDSFTLVRVLNVCSQLGDLKSGEWVHRCVEEKGKDKNVFVATSVIDMYTKCGSMEKARGVFDAMAERDVVTWSTMIGGYSSNGLPQAALELFSRMQDANVMPDCYTMVAILSACGKLGALEMGHRVSRVMDMNDFLMNPVLGTSLIDMYAKCGSTAWAWTIFEAMIERDLIVWNAMISGLAMTGHGKVAFALFAQIVKLGIRPCGNTFVSLLCSCSHTGEVEDGRHYFDGMSLVYSITPRIEHYGCMVDLLGRAGLLKEAYELIKVMPMDPNAVVWGALLGGCKLHRDTVLAEHVLKQLIVLEPHNSGNYVLLSNIYATSGRWEDSAKLRLVMKEKGIQKTPGSSWVELNGVVHEFRVGDKSHALSEKIYMKLDELEKQLKALGYMPTTEVVLFDIEEEEKMHTLRHHSEKLAIAFALITTGPKETIRVVKNLRVCNDCHTTIKLISKVTDREIIVRDTNRFHCFKEGSCSCNDYW